MIEQDWVPIELLDEAWRERALFYGRATLLRWRATRQIRDQHTAASRMARQAAMLTLFNERRSFDVSEAEQAAVALEYMLELERVEAKDVTLDAETIGSMELAHLDWTTGSVSFGEPGGLMLLLLGLTVNATDALALGYYHHPQVQAAPVAAMPPDRKTGGSPGKVTAWHDFWFTAMQMLNEGELTRSNFASQAALIRELLARTNDSLSSDHVKPQVSRIWYEFIEAG